MRLVADTNTLISSIFWDGAPRRVLDLVVQGRLTLFTSVPLLWEFEQVLHRPAFADRLARQGRTPADVIQPLLSVCVVVHPAQVGRVVHADADDDKLFACAVSAQAHAIVSGDRHVLAIGRYRDIEVLTAGQLLQRDAQRSGG
jgi:putative PIN family toxin of toxin-antitoxin system